jgi:hypothetical protein
VAGACAGRGLAAGLVAGCWRWRDPCEDRAADDCPPPGCQPRGAARGTAFAPELTEEPVLLRSWASAGTTEASAKMQTMDAAPNRKNRKWWIMADSSESDARVVRKSGASERAEDSGLKSPGRASVRGLAVTCSRIVCHPPVTVAAYSTSMRMPPT